MTFYIFTRHKKTGHKKIIKEVDLIEEARHICGQENNKNQNKWFEFTEDVEYTKNRGN